MKPEMWAVLTAICWAVGSVLEKKGVKLGEFTPVMGTTIRTVVSLTLLFSSQNHFVQPKAEKCKIQFLVTKRGQKFNTIKFSDPQPRNCG